MKRGWKIFWIVCAVCLVVGIVCCAASFVMGVTVEAIENRFPNGFGFAMNSGKHYDDGYTGGGAADDDYADDGYEGNDYADDDYDGDDYVYDDYDDGSHHPDAHHGTGDGYYETEEPGNIIEGSKRLSFQDVSAIDMEVWAGEIEVVPDAGLSRELIIDTDNINKKLCLRCYMDGNELKIESRKKLFGINDGKAGKILLRIPEGARFEEVSIGLAAGYLRIADIEANELSVDVGAGEGVIGNFRAIEAELDCGAGSLTAAGAAEAEIDIDCGVGEIVYTAYGKESDYNYEIDCGMGEIVCGESTYAGLGRNKTIDHHGSREMDISCGIGSVAVNFSGQ